MGFELTTTPFKKPRKSQTDLRLNDMISHGLNQEGASSSRGQKN